MATTVSIYNAQTVTHLYVESCFKCGIVFGLPSEFQAHLKRDKSVFHCPNGHPQAYIRSTEADLRADLERAQAATANWREATARAENSLRTTKGHLTRLKKRAEAGVCIHCNRTFQNVQRHMASQHAE
jgi:hypothetical protein